MATPQMKRVVIDNIAHELSGGIDRAIAVLQERRARYEAEGYTNLELEIETDYEYGDTYARAYLSGERMETEHEVALRERAARDAEQCDRNRYEQLKAKFG